MIILTSWEWPDSTAIHSYSKSSLVSHIQIVLSLLQVAKNFPSGDHDTLFTSFSWPSKVETHSYSSSVLFQIDVVPSNDPLARYYPQGDHAIVLIVLVCPPSKIAYFRVSQQYHKVEILWDIYQKSYRAYSTQYLIIFYTP